MMIAARPIRWLTGLAAGFAPLPGKILAAMFQATPGYTITRGPASTIAYRHEGVLGTSLNLLVQADHPAETAACEQAVLMEIDRVTRIASIYDPESEISRFNRGAKCSSPDLARILAYHEHWRKQTGGAISAHLGGVIALWREAEALDRLPSKKRLAFALAERPSLNIDALGKGYVIDRAVEAARQVAPAGLLEIGGDMRAWGNCTWQVGIADPGSRFQNSPLLTTIPLREMAVATSGSGSRGFQCGGRRYSHLLDPRTGWPVPLEMGSTVVAGDCVTANALSTAACVLGPDAFEPLAVASGVQDYSVTGPARSSAHGLLQAAENKPPATAGNEAEPGAWPAGFRVQIDLALRVPDGGRIRRPYLVCWIEGPDGKAVRTLTIWGRKLKYVRELTEWWGAAGPAFASAPTRFDAISRATHPAGRYSIVWDGRDDHGSPLKIGEYRICVEVDREEGNHVLATAGLLCRNDPASSDLPATTESMASRITYGP